MLEELLADLANDMKKAERSMKSLKSDIKSAKQQARIKTPEKEDPTKGFAHT